MTPELIGRATVGEGDRVPETGDVGQGHPGFLTRYRMDAFRSERRHRPGESAEEVAWQLGHRNSTVTRAVYIQEVKSAERMSRRRARLDAEYSGLLEAAAARPA